MNVRRRARVTLWNESDASLAPQARARPTSGVNQGSDTIFASACAAATAEAA